MAKQKQKRGIKLKIRNKQDVIKWLKRLKKQQPLTTKKCLVVYGEVVRNRRVEVFTDQVIRDRYQGMIDYLESDEVEEIPGFEGTLKSLGEL